MEKTSPTPFHINEFVAAAIINRLISFSGPIRNGDIAEESGKSTTTVSLVTSTLRARLPTQMLLPDGTFKPAVTDEEIALAEKLKTRLIRKPRPGHQ